MNTKKAFVYSLILHSLVLLALIVTNSNGGTGDGNGKSDKEGNKEGTGKDLNVEIIPPPQKEEPIPDETIPETEDEALLKKAPHANQECPQSFGGIGITQHYDVDSYGRPVLEVAVVHQGYPAARAGIRPGDLILDEVEIRGEVGTEVTIEVQRGTQLLRFTLIRDKICTEEIKP